jgi:hypothetical protein
MINIKSAIFVFLLFLILPGCLHNPGYLVRYGEKRLEYLLDITKEWGKPGVDLTEDKIKEKLGKPGFLKPIFETNLDLASLKTQKTLRDLDEHKGVLLKYYPDDLYDELSGRHGRLKSLKLLSYVYDRVGLSEEMSLTFYIGSLEDGGRVTPRVFGWDYVKYGTETRFTCNGEKRAFINYDKIDGPEDYLRLPYTFLVDSVIGLKQFAGEIIKSPFSFIEAEFIKNMIIERKIPFYRLDGFKAAIEDWRNGVTALTYRYRIDGNQDMLATTQNLLGEIPLIGSVFDQWRRKESGTADKLFLTRGIFGGNNFSQNTALWVNYLEKPPGVSPQDPSSHHANTITPAEKVRLDKEENPGIYVKAIPYRYGSNVDVFWALFNISHGYAYDMTSEIISKCDVHPGDSIYLSGHSGGVQRSIAAARILNDDGIRIEKIYGIAGPALGYSPSKRTQVVLNSRFLDDPVSEITRLLRYITLDLLTLNIDWYDDICNNSRKEDEFYKHITPGFVDGRTRLKYDGYLNACLTDFLK